jgi:cysteine desulfurase
MKRIYMDHAATTPVDPEVVAAMLPFFTENYGNASSMHAFGQEARQAIEQARESIALLIGAKPDEIIFTSGGTESDNFAVKGIAYARKDKGNHIITSAVEHHARSGRSSRSGRSAPSPVSAASPSTPMPSRPSAAFP